MIDSQYTFESNWAKLKLGKSLQYILYVKNSFCRKVSSYLQGFSTYDKFILEFVFNIQNKYILQDSALLNGTLLV